MTLPTKAPLSWITQAACGPLVLAGQSALWRALGAVHCEELPIHAERALQGAAVDAESSCEQAGHLWRVL